MANRFTPIVLALVLSSAVFDAAYAEDGIPGFQSPSKNISCIYSEYDGQRVLRCDLGEMAEKPPRPAGCEQEWGHSFEVSARGDAGRVCTGDTLIGQPLAVLSYGDVWQRGGITCKSEPSGVTCFNADRHGFSLSRGKQDVF